ncbi:MAG: toprim domain-containing protein [Bacteroides sp.]|nr:toprim domain-containing protein [Bacteroides sp.]
MEIDYEKLKELDIKNDGKKKQFCPECHANRTDKRDKSLSVDWERCIAHCHYCGKNFFFGKTERIGNYRHPKVPSPMKEKMYHKPAKLANETAPDDKVLAWFASRGIPAEVVTQEGITQAARSFPQTSQVEKCIVFPYMVEGELVNRKYRTARKHFMLESGAELVPWRIDHIRETPECIITEGEMDALSFIVAGRDDVISVPNGAQKNLTWLDRFIETHLENKERIYIAADTDAKGLDLRAELVRRFGEEKCRIVTYGEGCKDANELLQKSGVEAVRKSIEEAQEVPLEGIYTASDVKEELLALFEKGLQKGAVLGMGELDDMLSLEVGRLMIVTGIPGDGKSEFLDEMAVHLSLNYDWRCAWFSPENFPVTLHHPKLIEKLIGKRFLKGLITPIEFETAVNYLSHNFFDILPEEGYRVDTILEKAEALVRRKGIRVFILDPYNCLEHQIPTGQSETQYISEFLEKLRSFARRRQVLVVLAAHPTKMKRDPLTKQFPVPTMYDISGSAAFFNKADFGIAIERDRTKEVTRVHVQKVKFRHLGYPGVASFKYNTHNGRFISIEEGKTPDIPDIVPDYDNSNWLGKKIPAQKELFFSSLKE